ncbi:MAG: PKD domain-containing protein [Candidatus Cloacimonetes bacterium]|nr:PKD domain-containing protein [Candidatus Cloacimonadota bacterium]
MKKLGLLLIFSIFLNMLTADGTPAEGSGTETDPYQIATLDNLLWLSTTQSCWSYYFIQIADIDAGETEYWNGGTGFSPIGLSVDASFSGYYDGAGHIIDGLFIDRPAVNYIGLFGRVQDAEIVNLGVTNVEVTGNNFVAGLVGVMNYSTMSRCFSSGEIAGNISTGGLGGQVQYSSINESFSSCNVSGNERTGGLVGYNNSESTINRCYAEGSVSGNESTGGLVGYNNSASTISDCYASGSVNGGENYTGGFAGKNDSGSTLIYCYCNGFVDGGNCTGGFAGRNITALISSCLWDIETSEQSNGIGSNTGTATELIGATTQEIQMENTFTDIGWDFDGEIANGTDDIWDINENINEGTPYIYDLLWSIYDGELLAQFYSDPTYGNTPLTVNFYDESVADDDIVNWEWDFQNDGIIDSYIQNPVFNYLEEGSYTVSLTIYCAGGETDEKVKTDYITVFQAGFQPEGNGSEENPYLIASLDNLHWLSITEDVWNDNLYYVQTQDIDASDTQNWNNGAGFSPIGVSWEYPFSGHYNGDGHSINGLYINRPEVNYTGLFGRICDSVIENLGVTNSDISGGNYSGGISGYNLNLIISECYTTGVINGANYTGGLSGVVKDESNVSKCYSSAVIYGENYSGGLTGLLQTSTLTESYALGTVNGSQRSGGLVGFSDNSSMITECYSCGDVNGSGQDIGGLVGLNQNSTISRGYAKGMISGDADKAGGLVGFSDESSTITECYAIGAVTVNGFNIGGFTGRNEDSSISNCIWNVETTGQETGTLNMSGSVSNLVGATTEQMQTISTYLDIYWDFTDETVNGSEDIWEIYSNINDGYPYFTSLFESIMNSA